MEQHAFDPHNPGPDTLYAASLDGSHVWRLQRDASGPKASPDGLRIAYMSERLRVRNLTGGCHRNVGDPRLADEPAWSHDGKRLAFTQPELFVANDAGRVTRLTTEFVEGPSWSPNGRELTFGRHAALWVAHADGSAARIVAAQDDFCFGQPQWLVDGETIAFCGEEPGPACDAALRTVSIATGAIRTLRPICMNQLLRAHGTTRSPSSRSLPFARAWSLTS
jgi:Tol biopolymer transport system component